MLYNQYGKLNNIELSQLSQFGELLTVNRTPIIELNSSYGTSALRDLETVAGTGAISSSNGEILLSTGATSSSTAILKSAEVGRYIPGYGAELGVGVRFDTLPTGNQTARWGGENEDETDGFYFGYDSGGLYIARKRNNVELNKTYQSSWNVDKVDGKGASGFNLDLTKGIISQIKFTWYGYGQILFGILGVVNNKQTFIEVHELSNVDFSGTSVLSPNLKIFAEAKNNADSSDLDMYIGGRQYSIIGNYVPKFRFTGELRTSVTTSTTVKPLISFRRKTAFNDRSIKLENYEILGATQDHYIEVRLGGTLTGESFGTPTDYTAAETALESDVSATAISGGNVVWTGLVGSGQANKTSLSQSKVDLDIPNGTIVSLCARSVTGSGTVVSAFKLREEW